MAVSNNPIKILLPLAALSLPGLNSESAFAQYSFNHPESPRTSSADKNEVLTHLHFMDCNNSGLRKVHLKLLIGKKDFTHEESSQIVKAAITGSPEVCESAGLIIKKHTSKTLYAVTGEIARKRDFIKALPKEKFDQFLRIARTRSIEVFENHTELYCDLTELADWGLEQDHPLFPKEAFTKQKLKNDAQLKEDCENWPGDLDCFMEITRKLKICQIRSQDEGAKIILHAALKIKSDETDKKMRLMSYVSDLSEKYFTLTNNHTVDKARQTILESISEISINNILSAD